MKKNNLTLRILFTLFGIVALELSAGAQTTAVPSNLSDSSNRKLEFVKTGLSVFQSLAGNPTQVIATSGDQKSMKEGIFIVSQAAPKAGEKLFLEKFNPHSLETSPELKSIFIEVRSGQYEALWIGRKSWSLEGRSIRLQLNDLQIRIDNVFKSVVILKQVGGHEATLAAVGGRLLLSSSGALPIGESKDQAVYGVESTGLSLDKQEIVEGARVGLNVEVQPILCLKKEASVITTQALRQIKRVRKEEGVEKANALLAKEIKKGNQVQSNLIVLTASQNGLQGAGTIVGIDPIDGNKVKRIFRLKTRDEALVCVVETIEIDL